MEQLLKNGTDICVCRFWCETVARTLHVAMVMIIDLVNMRASHVGVEVVVVVQVVCEECRLVILKMPAARPSSRVLCVLACPHPGCSFASRCAGSVDSDCDHTNTPSLVSMLMWITLWLVGVDSVHAEIFVVPMSMLRQDVRVYV